MSKYKFIQPLPDNKESPEDGDLRQKLPARLRGYVVGVRFRCDFSCEDPEEKPSSAVDFLGEGSPREGYDIRSRKPVLFRSIEHASKHINWALLHDRFDSNARLSIHTAQRYRKWIMHHGYFVEMPRNDSV